MEQDRLKFVAEYLKMVVTSNKIKLAWGNQQRQLIKDKMDKGETPDNYRVRWIRETRAAIVGVLAESAEKFNRTFKHDLISVNDMTDVLMSTVHQFNRVAAKMDTEKKKLKE